MFRLYLIWRPKCKLLQKPHLRILRLHVVIFGVVF